MSMRDQNGLTHYQAALRQEFESRQKRNPSYSLRSFARDLGVSPATLSEVMRGMRHFRHRTASQVGARLGWNDARIKMMATEIQRSQYRKARLKAERIHLQSEHMHDVAESHLMTLIYLAKIRGAKADPSWIAKRIGITAEEAEQALTLLSSLGHVTVASGKLLPGPNPHGPFVVSVLTQKIADYQKSLIRRACSAISETPKHRRLSLIRMVPLDPDELIQFERLLWVFFESVKKKADRRDSKEVYCLSAQLFPMTK